MALERAAKVSEIPVGSIRELQIGGKSVALANVGGTFYAISNTRLHPGGRLGEGQLERNVGTCPWHGGQFDVTRGRALMNPNAGVGCLRAEVQGDEIYVDLG